MELKKKEFKYRGKTLEELKTLDVREFAKELKSRPRRTVLRQFQELEKFISRSKKKLEKKKQIRTHQRGLIIVPEMVDMKISVYNGQIFIPIQIIGEMLGHRLGEFALTRTRVKHGSAGVGATKGSKALSKK
ncbi:30S ribosomal protein S19 [Candidatus Pacearchaeota archaeon]|nr:30S ribosomal protein S19 [Candidatus Pacearchaeota archaeon]